MKKNTLEAVRNALSTLSPAITIDETIAAKAKRSLDRMLELS
jgi:quinolinate synthase